MYNSQKIEDREILLKRLKQCKVAIDGMLKQYRYQQKYSVQANINKLCACLENIMNVQNLQHFVKFMSNEQHLPIQFNLKAIKYQNLVEVFEDWLNSEEHHHQIVVESNSGYRFRNRLFYAIFKNKEDIIRDYFTALSEKQKIRDLNLFQLLSQLLNSYFLYEYNSDHDPFFQKTTSFETFMKIIQLYISSGKRNYIKDNSVPKDQSYIRLNEFEQVIQFWENVNQELTLQQEPRKNKIDGATQVEQYRCFVDEGMQTDLEKGRTYLNFINATLYEVSTLLSKQNDPEILKSLNEVFQTLRSQRVFAMNREQRQRQRYKVKKLQRHPSIADGDHQQFFPTISLQPFRAVPKKKQKLSPQSHIAIQKPIVESLHEDDSLLKTIYKYLCSRDELNYLTLSELQIFFYHLGLTKAHDNHLINNLVEFGYVESNHEISWREFKVIVKQLMKETNKINNNVLKNYVNNFQDLQAMFSKTTNVQNNSSLNNTTIFPKSEFLKIDRNLLSRDNFQGIRRYMNLLDSDESSF